MNRWQRWKDIMKCYPFEEKRLDKWTPPYIVQPKFDGVRCRAVPLPLPAGGYLLLSSEGNIIYSVPHINEALNRHWEEGLELDGELYCHGWSFDQIVSVTSRTINLHHEREKIQYHIFDYVEEEAQCARVVRLNHMNLRSPLIKVPYWVANDLQDIMKIYKEIISWGYEGIIVRNSMANYERKRSTWVMKFKPKKNDTYTVIGVEEEISINGTPKGTLGALVCDSGDGSRFNVGTGFTKFMRQELWNSKDELIGKKVLVEYQHITPGRKVPRFPVFAKVIE